MMQQALSVHLFDGWRIFLCTDIPYLVYPFIGLFLLLSRIMKNAAINFRARVFRVDMFSSPLGMELLSHLVTIVNHLRNGRAIFQSVCTILCSHQQCTRVLVSLHSHQHSSLSDFLILVMLVGTEWYIIVVSYSIFLTTHQDPFHVFYLLLNVISVRFSKERMR